jgi:hypothetical protein
MRGLGKSILLGLALLVNVAGARADDLRLRTPDARSAPEVQTPRLGRPIPLSEAEPPPPAPVQPVSTAPTLGPRFVRAQSPDVPPPVAPVPVPAVAVPPPPPPPPPPPAGAAGASESYLCGQVTTSKSGGFLDNVRDMPGNAVRGLNGFFGGGPNRSAFQSDTCFPWMISPVSEPFFAEDPRALTEVRPIFIYQAVPHSNPVFGGGSVGFFGTQARLAVTERLSLVINKLGFVWTDPHNTTDGAHRTAGFSELWLGPKYTIIRNDQSRTLLAAGLTFQIPTGPGHVFQDTGSLTLAPYLSFAQNFLKTGVGSFNFMNTTLYAFVADNRRTDYFFTQFHLDFDVMNWNKFFPLIEMNWIHYTQNGGARPLSFEGKDLFNFGSMGIAGMGELSLALGFRYKFCEGIQLGTAFQFPIAGHRDLDAFRWTIDLIFRY